MVDEEEFISRYAITVRSSQEVHAALQGQLGYVTSHGHEVRCSGCPQAGVVYLQPLACLQQLQAAACSAAADAVNTDVQPRSETLKQDEKLHLSVRQRSLKIYSSEL